MKQTFTIEHQDLTWELVVEIDQAKAAPAIKEMVEFWHGWQGRLAESNGDYTKAFLLQLARECLVIAIGSNLNSLGIIAEFEKREGWCLMDGSQGIKIICAESYRFDSFEFRIKD